MSKGAFIGLGVAAFVLLYGMSVWVIRPRMERDLVRRTKTALEKSSIKVKDAKFTGRDGEIEIVRSGDGQIAHAAEVADRVFGVRVAKISAQEEIKTPPSFKIERVGENIRVEGVLPNDEIKGMLLGSVEQAFTGMTINDEIKISNAIDAPGYLSELRPMFGLLLGVAPEGSLELSGPLVSLAGEVPDAESRERLKSKAQELLPRGLQLRTSLHAPERVEVAQAPTENTPNFRRELEATRLCFEFDSTQVTAETAYLVEPLIEMIKDHNRYKLKIIGHADATGTEAYNLKLSERRSSAIAGLLKKHGVNEGLLEVEGRGESQPASDNTTTEGRAKNRRVEFEVVEGS